MQAEAAAHQPRQDADRGLAEDLARELRRAVAGGEPAERAAGAAAGAVGQFARGGGETVAVADLLVAAAGAQVDQAGLGPASQRLQVDAGRDREQDVAQVHALADRVAAGIGGVMAAAGVLVRLGHRQLAVEQGLDRRRGGFADRARHRRRVVVGEQAGADRRLAQQLGAGALPQFARRQALVGSGQRDAVDLRRPRLQLRSRAHAALRGSFWPAGTFSRRERTSWYGRNR